MLEDVLQIQRENDMKEEHFLKWWGGCKDRVKKVYGYDDEMYFDTELEMLKVLNNIKEYTPFGLGYTVKHGVMTRQRPVAILKFSYDGKEYDCIDDSFGAEYKSDDVGYWWEEGNGACDCNRSSHIRHKYPEFPELPCGNKIELDMHVEFVDWKTPRADK